MIGKTISHYKIIEKLGAGGMGIVYKAQDLKLDRFVALKFLPPHLTTSEDEKQRFIHEAKAASSLDHNNICNIYEIDETEDGQLFISMACYEGNTLDKRIKDKPLPIEESTDITIQIAQGLAKAHEKEIVHRDIKPANIMLTDDGVVKVLDFGLAKLSTQTKLTKESTTLGTVSYMSTEQAKGDDVDYRTDIWSLGVIFYEMLSGQLPFKGEYESAVIYSILNDAQEPVTGLRTGIPMELERIINKCLQKSPADRYQHLNELVVDLRSLKRDFEPISTPLKEEPPKKRYKSVLLPIAILSIVILIIAGYLLIPLDEKSVSGWENSIAVLPFADLSQDKDQEYFCNGMTEQIITNLSKIKRLKVIGRTSIMKFKNTSKTLPEIGQELNVSHILEGSIRKQEDNIRVTAQLINSEDGSHLWADDFDRKLDDVFMVQDDISEKIARALLKNLSVIDAEQIKTYKPDNIEAWEYLKKGEHIHLDRFLGVTWSLEDFRNAERMLKKAVELDPNYAPSYALLADLYNTYYNFIAQTDEEKAKYLELQETFIKRAVDLDPDLVEVQAIMVFVHDAKNELDQAYASAKRALEINPNYLYANVAVASFFGSRGLYGIAIKYMGKALESDPLYVMGYVLRANWHMNFSEYVQAETDYKKGLEINPNHWDCLFRYSRFLIRMKRYEEAEKILRQMKKNYPDKNTNWLYALIYASKGDKEKALHTFKEKSARIFALLGMKDEAISLLNKYYEQDKESKYSRYLRIKNQPFYDNLRSDPRFQEILAKHKELYEENLAKYGDRDI